MGTSNNKNYTITTLCGSMLQYIEPYEGDLPKRTIQGWGPIVRVGVIRQNTGYPYSVVRGRLPTTIGTNFIFGGTSMPSAAAPTPVAETYSYTEIVSASNPNNSSSMHVGSLYLDARTYTTFGVMITDIKGGVGGSNAHAELKRFTDGTSLVQLSNTGTAPSAVWRSVTTSSLIVSTADWYDIYISASGNPATSSIRGIFYEY